MAFKSVEQTDRWTWGVNSASILHAGVNSVYSMQEWTQYTSCTYIVEGCTGHAWPNKTLHTRKASQNTRNQYYYYLFKHEQIKLQ